jgi:hypothetical protein
MGLHKSYIGRLTIASGGTNSNVIAARELGAAHRLAIYPPAALTGTVTLKAAYNEDAVAADCSPIKVDGGTDIAITAAKVNVVNAGGFEALMVTSGSAEGADRVFEVFAVLDIS